MNTSDTGEHGDYLRRLDDRADAAAVHSAEIAREDERTNPDGDAGAIALLRCLPTGELESMYRHAKADETDKGHHAACLIGRELIIRRTSNAQYFEDGEYEKHLAAENSQVAEPLRDALNDFAKVRGAL